MALTSINVNSSDTGYAHSIVDLSQNGAKFNDLNAALAAVPNDKQKGGMTITFVQSSDNKYVQYRCISNTFTIDTTQWAIYSNGVYISNPEFIAVWTDKDKKILIAIENDGNVIFGAGVPRQIINYVTEKIAELSLDEYEDIVSFLGGLIEGDKTLQELLSEKVDKEENKSLIPTQYIQEIDNPEFISICTDNNGKILLGIEKNGNILFGAGVPSQILGYFNEFYKELKQDINTLNSDVEDLQSLVPSGIDKVLSTHMDKESMLYSMSFNMPFYYYEASATPSAAKKKRLVFAWLSDVHGFGENYGRFVKYANNYKDVIDFMLVTGDISALEPNDGGWHDTQETYAPNSEVPILICLGNHDVTNNSGNGVFYDSLEDMDAELITPWATQIGWTNKGNGSYYYKDFVKNDYKYRFIILNDYERPRLVADGSWETITYDSSLPAYNPATSYVAGDKVNLNSHSYQAVKSVSNVSPTRTYYDKIDGRYITEQQALWLCDALNSMPDGYQAVICTHQKVGAVNVQSSKFTSHYGIGSGGFQMCQDGDLIVDVIKAFTNRTAINKKYEMTQRGNNAGGEVISGFDFTLVYDFSNSISLTSKIKCCLTGHTHADEVSKINNLGFDLYDITLKNGGATFQCDDMPNFGERSKDAFNIVSVDGSLGFKMMRIGQDINDRFELRDNIIINI